MIQAVLHSHQGSETSAPTATTMSSLWRRFSRRKQLDVAGGEGTSKLDKCLNTFDLTALGIGATLGEFEVAAVCTLQLQVSAKSQAK